jgi:DNA-directed RNA polymerase specialized sigma24 family protein
VSIWVLENVPTLDFDPNRSFRGLLTWKVRIESKNVRRERQRRPGGWGSGDSYILDLLHTKAAPRDQFVTDSPGELAEQPQIVQESAGARANRQDQVKLIADARDKVQKRVKSNTWEAFRLRWDERKSIAEVASLLDMSKTNVAVAMHRVIGLIEEEVRNGERGNGGTDGQAVRP